MAYNRDMERDHPIWSPSPGWIDASTYFALVVMGAIGLSGMATGGPRLALVALGGAFGALYTAIGRNARVARWPRRYFAAQALLVAAMVTLPSRTYEAPHFLLFVVAMQAVVVLPRREAAWWLAAFIALSAATILAQRGPGAAALIPLAFNSAVFLLIGTFGQGWHQSELERRRNAELLAELHAAQARARELAVAEERNRLAREVHDSIGHRLTVAVVQLEGARRLIPRDPARAAGMVEAMRQQMKAGLADLRRTVGALREGPDEPPLDQALAQLARAFEGQTGLAVALTLPPALPALPAGYPLALYRAAQESLTNVQRHAAARRIWLALEVADHRIALVVGDDGRGWPAATAPAAGFGLRGMRERIGALGGVVGLGERPGGGAEVRVTLPLAAPAEVA